MSLQKIKCIKLTIDGETKRLKVADTFDSLVVMAKAKFPEHGLEKVKTLKFYYLDDDQELISISSHSDYLEALEMEEITTLKLIVAESTMKARQMLEVQLNESFSLAQSISNNQQQNNFNATGGSRASNIFSRAETMSDFISEPFMSTPRQQPQPEQPKMQDKDEIVGMIEGMKTMFQTAMSKFVPGPSVKMAATMNEAMTAAEKLPELISDFKMPDIKMPEVPEMFHLIDTKSEKVDEPKPETKPAASESQMSCTLCKGAKCAACNDRGFFTTTGLEAQMKVIKDEIKELCDGGLKDIFQEHKRSFKQDEQVHKNIICDVCEADVKGIRYKCTQCDDYDLCEKCESKGHHQEHVMLKIRKVHHAPAKLICKYGGNGPMAPFLKQACDADGYLEKVVDMSNMAETIKSFCQTFKAAQQPAAQAQTFAEAQPTSDLKMPEIPEVLKPNVETKESTVIETLPTLATLEDDDEYVLEDVSIVEDMTKDSQPAATELKQPVVEELKFWTPKPSVEQPLSKEECYKLEAVAEEKNLSAALLNMLDFGFTDFTRNKELLQRFNMNIEATVTALLEDAELYE